MTKFDKLLKTFPPFIIRVLARDNGYPLTRKQIIERSGLSGRKVDRLSRLRSWDDVTGHDMREFLDGCSIDLLKMGPHKRYLKDRGKRALPILAKVLKKK